MLRLWWPAFRAAGFHQSDFDVALPAIITSDSVPNWPREHLAAVNRELRRARQQRTRRETSKAAPKGAPCRLCGWSGWVRVPLPADVFAGQWQAPHRTGCVVCTKCGPGQRTLTDATAFEHTPPMTIDDYEDDVCPDWATHIAEQEHAEQLMLGAVKGTDRVTSVPNLKRILADRFTAPRLAS